MAPCDFTDVVSRTYDGRRLAEANRDAAAADGAPEASAAGAHHAAQHPGATSADDEKPVGHVGDVPAVLRAAQRAARAVAHTVATGYVHRHHRQQAHQLHRQCTWLGDYTDNRCPRFGGSFIGDALRSSPGSALSRFLMSYYYY